MKNFVKNEKGQGMVEYALILALISIVCVVIMKTLGGKVNTVLTNVDSALSYGIAGNA